MNEFNLLFSSGLKNYLSSAKNIVNSTMNLLYLFWFGLHIYTILIVRVDKLKIKQKAYWDTLLMANYTDYEDVCDTIYWLNTGNYKLFKSLILRNNLFLVILDRFYWDKFDPIILADGFFAFANLLSVIRICFILPVNQSLGPLQISLGNMISVNKKNNLKMNLD